LEPCGETARFDAAGEPGRDGSWHEVGTVDPRPKVYSFLAGGMQELPPYRIYENRDAFPRAFVVHQASPLAGLTELLAQLKSTDFHREVLLEDVPAAHVFESSSGDQPSGAARIHEYRPNRVAIDVQSSAPGYLVSTDVWFPGWTCTVDGQPAPIHRANFLFRAVALPAGDHHIVFRFEPASYRWGKRISILALIGVAGISSGWWWRKRISR
jgi:hypothetical protein